ncbi:MAG TPA: hypothetical protein VG309_09270 [Rhizomicrobium sp.]|nr:hypothetical protein [Rhizomicrobium sp.]
MNRLLSSAAIIAICAGLANCAGSVSADNASTQTPAAPQVKLDDELAKAHDMRVQGNFADAGRLLAQLVLFAPTDGRVVGEYGKLLAQEGQSKTAIQFLTQAVALNSGDWTLYSALGVAYDQVDDRANAKVAYEKALALKPGEATILNNIAVSRMLAKDYVGAQRYFDEAKANGSDNPKIAANLAMLAQLRGDKSRTAVAQNAKPKNVVAPAKTHPQAVASTAPQSLMPKPVEAKDIPPQQPVAVASMQAKEPPTVMMQQVPKDPLAGPVASHAPHKIVTAAKPKTKAPAKPSKTTVLANASKANALMNHAPELRASTDDLRPATSQQ